MKISLAVIVCLLAAVSVRAEGEWDLYDGTELPTEGRSVLGLGGRTWYDRLKDGTADDVPPAVRDLQTHTAGVCFRFKTPSDRLLIDWTPLNDGLAMWHMPSTGVSGVDVYQQDPERGWRMVKPPWPASPKAGGARYVWSVTPNLPTYVYLPLYNGLRAFTLGVRPGCPIEPVPHASGIVKPVVIYGTSVTQGGCVSHPGVNPTSVAGRLADVPVVNLGFSGSGKMEPGLFKRVSEIDASCYVLHTVGNMDLPLLKERFEKFTRDLMAKRPGVPVIVATDRYQVDADHVARNDFLAAMVKRLKTEDPVKFAKLSLACDDDPELMDVENTVEGVHFSDIGAKRWGTDLGRALKEVLGAAGKPPADGSAELLPKTLRPKHKLTADWWRKKFERNKKRIAESGGTFDIVMLGDSITHYWEVGEGLDDSHDIEILEKKYKILNCGYGGDQIENLLYRIENGELDGYRTKLVTLMIGTNNCGDREEDIVVGVRKAICVIRRKQPQAKILLMAYLPIGEKKDDARRKKMEAVTPVLKRMADDQTVFWFDNSHKFLKADGTTDRAMFDYEYIHPSTEGYRVWREDLEPVFRKFLGK